MDVNKMNKEEVINFFLSGVDEIRKSKNEYKKFYKEFILLKKEFDKSLDTKIENFVDDIKLIFSRDKMKSMINDLLDDHGSGKYNTQQVSSLQKLADLLKLYIDTQWYDRFIILLGLS